MSKEQGMGPRFKIKYLLNSAVYIQYGATGLLVDGVLSNHQMFDIYDKKTENDIWNRRNDFEGLTYLLFTHCHNDHYGRKNVCKFLEMHKGIKVLIPGNHRIPDEFIAHAQKDWDSKFQIMQGEVGEVITYDFGELKIECMKTAHTTFKYPEHYCINIVSPTENVLLTADMEFNRIPLLQNFSKRQTSSIFINHLAMLHRSWRKDLLELGYDKIYFYHLPTENRDYYHYRPRALRNWDKYQKDFPMAVLLDYQPKIDAITEAKK